MKKTNSKILTKIVLFMLTMLLVLNSITINNVVKADEEENVEDINTTETYEEEVVEENEEVYVEEKIVLNDDEVEVKEETIEEEIQEENIIEEVLEEEKAEEIIQDEVIYNSGTLKYEANDYEITIDYDESSLIPEDAKLKVEEIISDSNEYNEYVDNAVNAIFDEEVEANSLPYARFFDITILSKDDEIIEPQSSVNVVIDLKDNVLETEDVEFKAIHFVEEENKIVNTDLVDINTEELISFEVESFSVYGIIYFYTVDFYYQDRVYHMNGGSELLLSDLLNKLDIELNIEDIDNINFSNDELIIIEKVDNDYLLKSLKAFITHELLTINLKNGESILINVEDEIASGTFGTGNGLKWSIDDEGHFILEPASGSFGTIDKQYCSANAKGSGSPRQNGRTLWPWEAYKDKIVTAEIKGEIRTYGENNNYELIGMFEWCDNLISVDVSGLNTSRIGTVSYFFANCPKLKTITGLDAWVNSVHQNNGNKYGVENLTNVASMFRNCTSLEEIDLSSWTSNGKMKNFQNMCNGCTSLKTFILNNENFITANQSQWQTSDHNGNGVFLNCNALETVDMSNITIKANNPNAKGLEEMFSGLQSLKEVNMNNIDLSSTTDLSDMFNNCEKLESLTFAPKSKLDSVTTMQGFVANCSNLKTLNITGLDNSKLTSIDREMGFADLDSLTTLIADNSNVWIYKNDKYPVDMENLNMVNEIDFIQDGIFDYTPSPVTDGYSGDTKEGIDVIEIIQLVVKDGTSIDTINYQNYNDRGKLSPGTYIRTSEIDVNDMAVPLTYYIIDGMDNNPPTIEFLINGEWKKWDNSKNGYDEGDVLPGSGYLVNTISSNGKLSTRIFTNALSNQQWKDGTDNNDTHHYNGVPIRITYPNSATSINGTKHDVVITINSIDFENMSRIPNTTDPTYTNYNENFEPEVITNPWGESSYRPDKKKIPGYKSGTYVDNELTRRYILNADIGELRFWNQITRKNVEKNEWADADITGEYLLSKGSGTYINFNLNISGAEDGQSVLYWCDDLDMPENESWTMHESDPNQDVKNAVNYAPGAEGIVLGSGNDLSSLTLANRTYLDLYNYNDGEEKDSIETEGDIKDNNDLNTPGVANYIIGSAPDPETKKTRFYVKSNASGSNYLWTTGISCETTILKSTSFDRSDMLDTHLTLKAEKTVNEETPPTALDRSFNFILEPASEISEVTVGTETKTNSANIAFPNKIEVKNLKDLVDFGKMTFVSPGANFIDTGNKEPIYNIYKVYTDSNNKKFFYNNSGQCKSWTEEVVTTYIQDTDEYGNPLYDEDNNPIMVEKHTTIYEEISYTPCIELTKVYVFKIYEKEGNEPYITSWDKTEYYLKVITTAPTDDEEMQKGSKLSVTIGKKAEGDSDITWGVETIKYGIDTKDNPLDVNIGTFNNEAVEVELAKGSINVSKKLVGRNWRDSDSFHFVLTTQDTSAPMPEGSQVTNDIRHADIIIDTNDIKDDNDDSIYKDTNGFNAITFTGAHLVDDNGAAINQKTFRYYIREEVPSESGDERITGVTYSTERYAVDVTVKREADELKISKTEIFKVVGNVVGQEVDVATFTNTYKANETDYKMTAEKGFKSYDHTKTLQDDDYSFILKPIGTYAEIAPMPKNTTGEGEERTLTVNNIGQGIKFEDTSDPEDGLDFLYNDDGDKKGLTTILLPYFNNNTELYNALHSEEGIDFEYEIYEVIPDGAINNNDGTYSLDDDTNHATTIYDGIHHTRKITVKVVFDEVSQEEVLKVEAHADDHKGEFYIDSNGNEKAVETISGYDASAHHATPDGAPVFRNQYIPYHGSLEVNGYWNDNNRKDNRSTLTYTLYKQVEGEDPVKVTKDVFEKDIETLSIDTKENGSVKWDNLPLYENGKLIKYSIVEEGAKEDYEVVYVEENTSLAKDKTATLNVHNLLLPEEINKEVTRTIHYVTNKGKTVFDDITSKVSFKATPKFKLGDDEKPIIDDNGSPIVEWYDEEGTLLGVDKGDGSGIDWNKSKVRKKLSPVKSKEKDHYEYDIETLEGIDVKASDKDYETTVIYTPDNYKIYFDPNEGEGNMPPQEMEWDDLKELNPNEFKRSGYEFNGWNTEKDGSGRSFNNMEEVINFLTETGAEITLYAQWKRILPPNPHYVPPTAVK